MCWLCVDHVDCMLATTWLTVHVRCDARLGSAGRGAQAGAALGLPHAGGSCAGGQLLPRCQPPAQQPEGVLPPRLHRDASVRVRPCGNCGCGVGDHGPGLLPLSTRLGWGPGRCRLQWCCQGMSSQERCVRRGPLLHTTSSPPTLPVCPTPQGRQHSRAARAAALRGADAQPAGQPPQRADAAACQAGQGGQCAALRAG